jgi:hypothetical protein
VAPSLYFYSPQVIHPTESPRQSPLNKANMSDWSPPASGTPCWINIPATEVGRGMCQSYHSSLTRWLVPLLLRSYVLHLTLLPSHPSFIITAAPANRLGSQAILLYGLQLAVHAPGCTERGLPARPHCLLFSTRQKEVSGRCNLKGRW